MKQLLTLIIGLILGTVFSYLAYQQWIFARGGLGMGDFVHRSQAAIADPDVMKPLRCAKLAMDDGQDIDHIALNFRLNKALKGYDDGSESGFYVLLYVKGYAFGQAAEFKDEDARLLMVQCRDNQSWLFKG